jgi:hypothetical protein
MGVSKMAILRIVLYGRAHFSLWWLVFFHFSRVSMSKRVPHGSNWTGLANQVLVYIAYMIGTLAMKKSSKVQN